MMDEKREAVGWADGGQDARIIRDVADPAERHEDKPHGRDRTKPRRHARRPVALDGKQADQDHEAEGQDGALEGRCGEGQTFDGRQHRDGRRDNRIAIEQSCTRHPEQDDASHIVAHGALGEGHQGQGAALAVVVGAQDEQHVLDRDDHDQRPEDERHDAEDHLAREGASCRRRRRGTPSRRRAGSCRCRRTRPRACRASASRTPRCARQRLRLRRCFGGQGLGLGGDGHHGRPGARPSRPAHQAATGAS